MSIKFFCTCGQPLSARADSAGRRSLCPRCGAPVGVPSLKPTHPGTPVAPMTPAERRQLAAQRVEPISPFEPPTPAPAAPAAELGYRLVLVEESQKPAARNDMYALRVDDPDSEANREMQEAVAEHVQQVRRVRRWRRKRPQYVERNGFDCLMYPFRAFGLVALLATGLTVLAALLLFVLFNDAENFDYGQIVFWGVLGSAAVAYTCGFLSCTLHAGSVGDASCVRWPGIDFMLMLKSVLTATVSFLPGPAVFAAVGWWFWLKTGDLTLVDRLVLWELGLAACLSWLLAFTAVTIKDRLAAAWPGTSVAVALKLGRGLIPLALVSAAVFWVHAGWLLFTLQVRANEPAAGISLLFLCCLSFLFWATFVCRWLGISWFHAQSQVAHGTANSASETPSPMLSVERET